MNRVGHVVILCLTAASCYRPDVLNGGFRCNTSPNTKSCPDGYHCEAGLCWGANAGPDARLDVGDGTEARDASAEVADVGVQCFQPKPGCTPTSGACDPLCQTGCGCREKCSVNTVGVLTCNTVVPGTLRNEFQSCTVVGRNTADQSDACAPGLVCVEDACTGVGSGSGRCYKFCRGDGDCQNSQCARSLPGGVLVCDVPNVDTCNPTVAQTGCPTTQHGCYIATTRPTHTVCDCPGSAVANEPCDGSRSCFPGLLCADPNGAGAICLKVCDLSLNGADCGGAASCRMFAGTTGGTMFNPKFGFCF
jgi:hypothetical protein